MNFLIDTNAISELRRRSPDANVVGWFRRADAAALYLSVLTLGEITRGAESLGRRDETAAQSLREWLDGLRRLYSDRIMPVDGEIAEKWGRMMSIRPLPVIDGLLAATAAVRGMVLVTRNLRDVAGLGVRVLDPWDAA